MVRNMGGSGGLPSAVLSLLLGVSTSRGDYRRLLSFTGFIES
jgi:hypothetical protein